MNSKLTKKETILLLLLAAINFTHIVDFMVLMPLQPQLEGVFTISPKQWSLVVSSYSFAAFFTGLCSVFFIDRVDRKSFLLWAYLGFTIGTFLCGVSNSYWQLVATRTLTGMFGGLISSAILAMVGDLMTYEKRGRAMGIIMMGFSAAAALGVPIGIYLGFTFNWRVPFFSVGVVSVLLLLLGIKFVPSLKSHIQKINIKHTLKNITLIFSNRQMLGALVFYFVLIFSQFLLIPFLTPYMVKNIGFSDNDLVFMYSLGGVATIITAPIIGKITDGIGHIKSFILMLFLSLIPLYGISSIQAKSFVLAYVTSTLFFILVSGRIIPAMAILVSVVQSNIRGMYMSFRSAFQQLASGLAAYVSGLIILQTETGMYQHYDTVGYIAIACSVLSIFFVRLVK